MKAFNLMGVDSNAFSIMWYTMKAMRTAKMSQEEIDNYLTEAKGWDYDNLIAVSMDKIDEVNEKLWADEDEEDFEHWEDDV